jgi:hypothetical protein
MTALDSHKSYRPLTTLMFRTEWILSGGRHDARLAHGVNVALHGVVSACVYLLSRFLFPPPVLSAGGSMLCALVAGLVFGVHPVHTESVVGVVSRADLLCTLFFIGGLVVYLRATGWQAGDGEQGNSSMSASATTSPPSVASEPTSSLSPTPAARSGPKPAVTTTTTTAAAAAVSATPSRSLCGLAVLFVLMFVLSTLSKELGVGLVAVCGAWEVVRRPLSVRRVCSRAAMLACVFVPYILLRMYLSKEEGTPFLSSFASSTLEKSGLMRRAENPFAFLSGLPRVLSINFLQAMDVLWHCVRVVSLSASGECRRVFVDVYCCR